MTPCPLDRYFDHNIEDCSLCSDICGLRGPPSTMPTECTEFCKEFMNRYSTSPSYHGFVLEVNKNTTAIYVILSFVVVIMFLMVFLLLLGFWVFIRLKRDKNDACQLSENSKMLYSSDHRTSDCRKYSDVSRLLFCCYYLCRTNADSLMQISNKKNKETLNVDANDYSGCNQIQNLTRSNASEEDRSTQPLSVSRSTNLVSFSAQNIPNGNSKLETVVEVSAVPASEPSHNYPVQLSFERHLSNLCTERHLNNLCTEPSSTPTQTNIKVFSSSLDLDGSPGDLDLREDFQNDLRQDIQNECNVQELALVSSRSDDISFESPTNSSQRINVKINSVLQRIAWVRQFWWTPAGLKVAVDQRYRETGKQLIQRMLQNEGISLSHFSFEVVDPLFGQFSP